MDINIGCGNKKVDGAIGIDQHKTPVADVVHNLTSIPWPFKDEEFDNAYAYDIIEHFVNVIPVMDEIWRIVKPGGKLYIRTTNFETEQSYRDPTHHHFFTLYSFDFFDPESITGKQYFWYTERKWKVLMRGLDGQETVFELEKIAA